MDLSTGHWSRIAPMIIPREQFSGALIGSKVYLAGGHQKYRKLDEFEVYDCSTGSGQQLRSMPRKLSNCASAVLDGFVYVSGGYDESNTPTSGLFRYDPGTDRWQQMKSMQHERVAHQMVALRGRLYVIGGAFTVGAEVWDPRTDQWSSIARPCFAYSFAGSTVLDGRLYISSGKEFEVYEPETNTWRFLNSTQARTGTSLVAVDDRIWAIGGRDDNNRFLSSIESFDILTGQWSREMDMDVGRAFHCSFVV